MIFCRLDYWMFSNTLHDLVKITNIIPSIKRDHAAISLELVNNSNDIKGPGLWKMNCSIWDDEDYVKGNTEKIPLWLAEGRKDLPKYLGLVEIQYKRTHNSAFEKKSTGEKWKRTKSKVKFIFETGPNDWNANTLNWAKDSL